MFDKNEIIKMARQTKLPNSDLYHGNLEAFAKLVAAKEREACAKVCEGFEGQHRYIDDIVEAIRARGEA